MFDRVSGFDSAEPLRQVIAFIDEPASTRTTNPDSVMEAKVCVRIGDRDGLAQYMARSPFSLARLIRITPVGKVLYKAEKDRCQRYPQPASEDLFGGVARNYQLFEPPDFLAELVQHIPNKGEHLVRYYGAYSNKARGLRAKNATAVSDDPDTLPVSDAQQADLIRKILEHCGLWHDPPPRAPPRSSSPYRSVLSSPASDPGITHEVDPDFLEHRRREDLDPPELPWDP